MKKMMFMLVVLSVMASSAVMANDRRPKRGSKRGDVCCCDRFDAPPVPKHCCGEFAPHNPASPGHAPKCCCDVPGKCPGGKKGKRDGRHEAYRPAPKPGFNPPPAPLRGRPNGGMRGTGRF